MKELVVFQILLPKQRPNKYKDKHKMQIKFRFWILPILALVFVPKAAESQNTTIQSTTVPHETIPAPKVNVSASALCQKCSCDIPNLQLDCGNGKLKGWFTDDDWSTLQNGDIIFETINLEHNNLTNIPQLRDYGVKHLYLAFNQISNIATGAFQNLTELTKLDLSHNKITSKVLVADVFKGRYSPSDYLPLDKMKELNLGYNELHNLDDDLFEHLPKLEVLILCKNTFKVIDHLTEIAIAGLTSVKTLDMSYMEIAELPKNFLHGPRDLEVFILSGNLLKKLPENLDLAVNLKALILDENLLENLAGDHVLPALKNLEYLSISYMPEFKRIEVGGLSNLQNLTTFIASNNPKFSYISPGAFYKNTKNPMFHDYPPLQKLYLHNNNLTAFYKDWVFRWDKISELDLRFNPWSCDENNQFLVNILMPMINQSTPILAIDVTCGSPTELKSVSLLNQRAKDAVRASASSSVGLILIITLVCFLVGVPIILATVVLYRRGCFGMLFRRTSPAGAHYSRAGSAEDLHI